MSITRQAAFAFTFFLTCLTTSSVFAQTVLFRTDFDDQVPSELFVANHEGDRAIVDGWYHWTPISNSLMNSFIEGLPNDISIRTRVRLLEEPQDDWIFVGVVGRDAQPHDGGRNYFAGITTDSRIGIGVAPGPVTTQFTRLDVATHSIDMQFDMLGDELSFTAWETGTEQPQPQVIIQDSSYLGSRAALSYNPRGSTNLPTVAFDFVEIVSIPEPTSVIHVLLVTFAVIHLARSRRATA